MQQDDDTLGRWTLPPNRPFEHLAERIPPEEIRKMATFGGLERNTAFHLALGSTLGKIRTRQHLLAAAEELGHAIQLSEDPERTWKAYQKRAEVLHKLRDSTETIAAALKALELLPEDRHYNKPALLELIQDANLRLGNRDAALEAAVDAWESAPYDPVIACHLIYTAHRTGNYAETFKIMKSALDSEDGAQFLGEIIMGRAMQRYITDYMSIACAKMGDLDVARDAFVAFKSKANVSEDENRMAAADLALAQLYFRFYRDDKKAITLWEDMVRDYPSTRPAFDASFALISLYFTKAKAADPSEAHTWVLKMEQLVAAIEPMASQRGMFPNKHELAALLGRWYAEQGETELARAKIRPWVRECIRDLTDRDYRNDYGAYAGLARALLCFGDRQNSAISWAFTSLSESVAEFLAEGGQPNANLDIGAAPAVPIDADTSVPFSFLGHCDGACDRQEATFKSYSACEICVDVTFCDECLQKLQDGSAVFRICNPAHPFVEIYPSRVLILQDPEGYKVHLDGGEVVSANDWLAIVSREWV
jgi:tetratricopeptide (TPR) repeat protein